MVVFIVSNKCFELRSFASLRMVSPQMHPLDSEKLGWITGEDFFFHGDSSGRCFRTFMVSHTCFTHVLVGLD